MLDPSSIPAEFRDQLGNMSQATTIPQLKAFLEQGGKIVAIGSSALNLAPAVGVPLENQITEKTADGTTRAVSSDKYYIPGSVLEVAVDTTHPAARGARPVTSGFRRASRPGGGGPRPVRRP